MSSVQSSLKYCGSERQSICILTWLPPDVSPGSPWWCVTLAISHIGKSVGITNADVFS